MTLFGCNHLAQVIKFFGKCKNLCVKVQFLSCFIVNLRAFSKYKPPGAYICMGDLTEGFLRYEFGGEGLYLEGLILSGFYGNLQKPA